MQDQDNNQIYNDALRDDQPDAITEVDTVCSATASQYLQCLKSIVCQCRSDGYLRCVRFVDEMGLIVGFFQQQEFIVDEQIITYLREISSYISDVIVKNIGDRQHRKKQQLKTKFNEIRFKIQQINENYYRRVPQRCQQLLEIVKHLISFQKHQKFLLKLDNSEETLQQIISHCLQTDCPCIKEFTPYLGQFNKILNLHLNKNFKQSKKINEDLLYLITKIEKILQRNLYPCNFGILFTHGKEDINKKINMLQIGRQEVQIRSCQKNKQKFNQS